MLASWRTGGGPYWVDLGGGTNAEVEAWLAGLGVASALIELLQLGAPETRMLPLVDAVFVSYPVP